MEELLRIVSRETGVSMEDILSRRGERRVCEARQLFIYLSSRILENTDLNISHFLKCSRGNVSIQKARFISKMQVHNSLKSKTRAIERMIIAYV